MPIVSDSISSDVARGVLIAPGQLRQIGDLSVAGSLANRMYVVVKLCRIDDSTLLWCAGDWIVCVPGPTGMPEFHCWSPSVISHDVCIGTLSNV